MRASGSTLSHRGSERGSLSLKRQIGRSIETRIAAERGSFNARRVLAIDEAAALEFGLHVREEEIPGSGHPSAQQVQREVEGVDKHGEEGQDGCSNVDA